MSESTSGSDAVRDLARQRQPLDGHAQTPSWVGPDRHPDQHQHLVPDQVVPAHDDLTTPLKQAAQVGRPDDVLHEAHWSGQSTGRTAMSLLLIAAAMCTLGAAALTVRTPDGDNASLLAICALATVGLFAIMATTRPMEVDLKGSMLTVHHRDTVDTFDLADPFQPVQIRGSLGSPSWSLALGKIDGGTVVVGSRTVKAAQLHPVVVHYRTKADSLRRARDQRFGA
jgi:hypothetical protein